MRNYEAFCAHHAKVWIEELDETSPALSLETYM